MATRDYRTSKAQPPPPLPSWMTDLSPQEQMSNGRLLGASTPLMGYAEMDQYSSGGIPPAGSMGELIANNYQNVNSLDPQGYALQSHDPTKMDRFGRAVSGAFKGYDTGNTAGNVGLQAGAGLVPGGQIINAGAGAIQGATSNDKVFNRVLPQDNSGRNTNFAQPTVMPRGINGGGLLDPSNTPGVESHGAGPGGPVAPGFAANPLASRPLVPGQSAPAQAPTGFTGGSGAMVDPYQIAPKDTLESLLSQAQRYTDYDASTGRTGMAGSGATGGGYQYSGFDFAQDAGNRDVGKSAKYAWAEVTKMLAAQGIPMPRTKEEAGAYAQQAAPLMAQLGFPINNIVGDKFSVAAREGQDTIDWLGDAGGENPTLTWQSEVLAPGPGMQGGGMGAGAPGLPTNGMDLSSSALFDTLMQQARDIAAGKTNGASILDTNALLQLLGK